MRIFGFLLLFLIGFSKITTAQTAPTPNNDGDLVQFSGLVLTEENGELRPVPYATIYLKTKKRGTYTDFKGFFSFVAEKGDKVVFSCVGFNTHELVIPDTLKDNRYSMVQLMTKDPVNLPTVVIMPWPSKEHFKIEYLALNVDNELEKQAAENLAENTLKKMRRDVTWDGKENASYYLREQAKSTYYIGQMRPMNIFSPTAWGDFFKAWKSGKFKKQNTDD